MLQEFDCIEEVEKMCKEAWLPCDIAEGEYWLEITWEHQGSENKFMIIYGKDNIEIVNRMLGYRHNHPMDHSKQKTA
jgi:hypothetical protein